MPQQPNSYDEIRPLDLQDQTLFKLNQKLFTYYQQLSSLGATVNPNNIQTANTWQKWTPSIITTMGYTLSVVAESSYFQQYNSLVFVNLDITLGLSGTASNNITFSPPANILPFTNNGNSFSVFLLSAGTPVAAYARTQNNGIAVMPLSGDYSLGLVEIVLSGWYRIS